MLSVGERHLPVAHRTVKRVLDRVLRTARYVFLDPRAEASYPEWDRIATETAAILRWAAGRDPYNRELSDLVGELATQSEAFRARWAQQNVRFHNTGTKRGRSSRIAKGRSRYSFSNHPYRRLRGCSR